jgi:carboxyl-terminal processing protease
MHDLRVKIGTPKMNKEKRMTQRAVDGFRLFAICSIVAGLLGCGGGSGGGPGGGGPNNPSNPSDPSGDWIPGRFLPSDTFANQCARPRTGTRPNGEPYPDVRGTTLAENNWLRSWTNELYLWYDEVVDRNPANYSNPSQYFALLKTMAKTPSGGDKDKFHFTWPTDEWESFSQSGVSAGYGATFGIISGTPPREVRVLLVEPGSPAAAAGLLRGDEILMIDDVSVVNGSNVDVLNAGLFPEDPGETHTFQVRSGGISRLVSMQSAVIESAPVHTVDVIPTATGNVGYLLFNDHIATAEAALMDAIEELRAANINDLVLDVRYNGGGFLAIASQLAYMIAGPSRTGGRVFERTVWNDKHPTTNPVTGEPLLPYPFVNQTVGLSRPAGTALPYLNLPNPRVYVLSTSGTCSASEAIMNSLRGIDFEVIQIGSTTCGKPYGFYPFDNCGTTYFSVQFKGVNAKNFGDYTDGFSPANTVSNRGTSVPGCSVADDLNHELGDPAERLLSVALAYRQTGQCSLPPAAFTFNKPQSDIAHPVVARPAYREIRIIRPGDFAP